MGYSGLNQWDIEWERGSGGGLSSPQWGWASGDLYSECEVTTSEAEGLGHDCRPEGVSGRPRVQITQNNVVVPYTLKQRA